ncbi:hypothetical protein [Edaphovirga cremea]|uniref:hypothetical protein n=1 Tax=Edaphovirga cremea TaxID=2267246 RepID=UPI0013003B63|nr:hypothetical protein [Edaphovirga cremea]
MVEIMVTIKLIKVTQNIPAKSNNDANQQDKSSYDDLAHLGFVAIANERERYRE